MSNAKDFSQDYYDKDYFADPKGKAFKLSDGSVEHWGYRNPEGEFLGAKDIAQAWKEMFNPENMLDVGCGRGTFVAYARDLGIEAGGFDFSEWAVNNPYRRCKKEWLKVHDATKPWSYRDQSFDLLVALDFFEHIYQSDITFIRNQMFRVARKWIFLQIATVDGIKEKGYLLKKGEPIPWDDGRTWAGHCTVMTKEFWLEKFEDDDWLVRRDMVNWFCSLVKPNIIQNWLLNTMLIMERL